jgi:peptidoglycan/xylan/chitin deacetylase (PgdA/CDA1 family)
MRVAVTIDTEHPDAPAAHGNAERMAEALAAARAPATFFLQGRWAAAYPGLTRRIADDGHAIGNHASWHAPMDMLTEEGMRRSVKMAERQIVAATGVDPRPWFRCPYGAGEDDPAVLAVLNEMGYRNVGWTVDANDWQLGRTAAEVVELTAAGVAQRGDGTIVLLHSWPDATADALPTLIARLRDDGADLVAIDALA